MLPVGFTGLIGRLRRGRDSGLAQTASRRCQVCLHQERTFTRAPAMSQRDARAIGRVLSETSREAFGQAIPPKSLQDENDKDARFGRQQRAGRVIQ